MTDIHFEGQSLVATGRKESRQRVELTFVDAEGAKLILTLPARVAGDMLVPVLAQFSGEEPRLPGGPEFSLNVTHWRIGHSNEEPKVIFGVNDEHLYAMNLPDAKKFWREIREEVDIVERRKPPTRQ